MCLKQVESLDHLFIIYEVAYLFWYKMFRWVDMPTPLSCFVVEVFEVFQGFGQGKSSLIGLF